MFRLFVCVIAFFFCNFSFAGSGSSTKPQSLIVGQSCLSSNVSLSITITAESALGNSKAYSASILFEGKTYMSGMTLWKDSTGLYESNWSRLTGDPKLDELYLLGSDLKNLSVNLWNGGNSQTIGTINCSQVTQ